MRLGKQVNAPRALNDPSRHHLLRCAWCVRSHGASPGHWVAASQHSADDGVLHAPRRPGPTQAIDMGRGWTGGVEGAVAPSLRRYRRGDCSNALPQLIVVVRCQVIFVVDASDEARFGIAKKHLHDIVHEQALHAVPVSAFHRGLACTCTAGVSRPAHGPGTS